MPDDKQKVKIQQALMSTMAAELDDLRTRSADFARIDRKIIDRATTRARVADLTIDDLAATIHEQLQLQRRELLDHSHRQYTVLRLKMEEKDPRAETRAKNFHERLCHLESGLRRLEKRGQ